jgi:hypothetical protein
MYLTASQLGLLRFPVRDLRGVPRPLPSEAILTRWLAKTHTIRTPKMTPR